LFLVLSRQAGEEGAPTKSGEVRGRMHGLTLIYPLLRNGALLLPLKKREKT